MKTAQPESAVKYWDHQAQALDSIYVGKSGIAKALDQWLRKDMYERFDWTLRESGDVKGKTVGDLGCGTGRYMVAYAKRGARRIVGLDSAPTMVEKSRQVVVEAGVADRCELRTENILQCRTDEVFDVTIAIGVFDYVADPIPFLSRIRSITRERFISTWPRLWTWRMPVRKVRLGLKGCPVYFFTQETVEELHRKAGFVCKKTERVGELFCAVAEPAK